MTKEVNEIENVEVKEVAQPEVQETAQISIQISDIIDALKIIEVAIERSTFKHPELVNVMPVYQKLQTFAVEVQKSEQKGE